GKDNILVENAKSRQELYVNTAMENMYSRREEYPHMPHVQSLLRRSCLLLLCGLSCFTYGCVYEVAYRPNVSLVETMGVEEALHRLQEILLHAIEPPIVQAEVTEDGFLYRTRQVLGGVMTETLLVHRVAFANAVYVRLYPNNVVVVQTSTKVLLARLVFGNNSKTTP